MPEMRMKLLLAATVGALVMAAYAVSLPPPLSFEHDRYLVVPLRMLSRDQPVTTISLAERGIRNEHTRGIHIVRLPDGTFLALSWKDPHLGCTVSYRSSMLSAQGVFVNDDVAFYNPCHGEQYDLQGRKLAGPAPRGMDRFGFKVREKSLWIDLKDWRKGPAPTVPLGATATPASPAMLPPSVE